MKCPHISQNHALDEAILNRYDGLNRLVGMETGDITASYTYRPDGLRSSKTVNGVITAHVWDGSNMVLELTGGAVSGRYVRGIGLIAGLWAGQTSYYTFNAHGDVTGLVNPSGTLTKSYDYDAFGNELTPSAVADPNPFRYTGEYWDTETGTIYLRARSYSPATGRFSTEDPIRAGLNWYAYCGGNPVAFVDPNGLDFIWITASQSVPKLGTTLGHTSALVQDENDVWHYFYWGPDHALLERVDNFKITDDGYFINPMGDIGNFNLWINTAMRDKLLDEGVSYQGTYDYTDSVYISGDFTKSYEYYAELVTKYNDAGKGTNIEYRNILNNCLWQTMKGFEKTPWKNITTKNLGQKLYNEYSGGPAPNQMQVQMELIFKNSSFTNPTKKAVRSPEKGEYIK